VWASTLSSLGASLSSLGASLGPARPRPGQSLTKRCKESCSHGRAGFQNGRNDSLLAPQRFFSLSITHDHTPASLAQLELSDNPAVVAEMVRVAAGSVLVDTRVWFPSRPAAKAFEARVLCCAADAFIGVDSLAALGPMRTLNVVTTFVAVPPTASPGGLSQWKCLSVGGECRAPNRLGTNPSGFDLR